MHTQTGEGFDEFWKIMPHPWELPLLFCVTISSKDALTDVRLIQNAIVADPALLLAQVPSPATYDEDTYWLDPPKYAAPALNGEGAVAKETPLLFVNVRLLFE